MDAFTFPASVDSKGRVTVPSDVRKRLGIDEKDRLLVCILASARLSREVEDVSEALSIVQGLESVRSFSYRDGVLEVFMDV